jgi:hypothetical protein
VNVGLCSSGGTCVVNVGTCQGDCDVNVQSCAPGEVCLVTSGCVSASPRRPPVDPAALWRALATPGGPSWT